MVNGCVCAMAISLDTRHLLVLEIQPNVIKISFPPNLNRHNDRPLAVICTVLYALPFVFDDS